MESRKLVWKETAVVAIGVAVCVGVMIGVFALLGYYDVSVLLGGIAGGVLAVLNFFFMAIIVNLAADRAESGDATGGQKLVKVSYPIRFIVLALLLVACAKSGYFHVLALVLPLIFVRPTLTIAEFFKKKGA